MLVTGDLVERGRCPKPSFLRVMIYHISAVGMIEVKSMKCDMSEFTLINWMTLSPNLQKKDCKAVFISVWDCRARTSLIERFSDLPMGHWELVVGSPDLNPLILKRFEGELSGTFWFTFLLQISSQICFCQRDIMRKKVRRFWWALQAWKGQPKQPWMGPRHILIMQSLSISVAE